MPQRNKKNRKKQRDIQDYPDLTHALSSARHPQLSTTLNNNARCTNSTNWGYVTESTKVHGLVYTDLASDEADWQKLQIFRSKQLSENFKAGEAAEVTSQQDDFSQLNSLYEAISRSVAVAQKADRAAYDVRYSCRTEPPKISRLK